MSPNRFTTMFLATIVLAGGCQSASRDGAAVRDPAPRADQSAARTSDRVRADADPGSRYEEQRVHEAMRGLEYESGRVLVDADLAAQLVPRPDAGLAPVERNRGERELQANDAVGAIAAFTRAVIHDPGDSKSYEALGRALLIEGESKEAEAAFRTALDLDPAFAEAGFQLGSLLQMTGRNAEAIEQWLKVVSIEPAYGQAHSRLAIELYYAGRYGESWRHVHEAQRLGAIVPPQFLPLLSAQMAEPVR